MDNRYAVALEEQVALYRWLQRTDAEQYMVINYRSVLRRRLLKALLRVAEPFYWAPAICRLVEQAAPSLPDLELREEDLPTATGYFWFDQPLALPGTLRNKDLLEPDDLHGFAWGVVRSGTTLHDGEQTLEVGQTTDHASDEYFAGVMVYGINRTRYRNRGLPSNALFWPFGSDVAEIVAKVEPELDPTGDYSKADSTARLQRQAQYFGTCLAFVNDVLEAKATQVPRHARRRLQHDKGTPPHLLAEPSVRVVTLRRKKAKGAGEAASVDWACQWMVSGHWRMQWYPSEGRFKRKWIAPYWKGPQDKPIKPPSVRLFRVVR